ncbi:L,D-transpeptidase [Paenibacillus sp. P96]|uniref:L,D-transpeptidase n=1 Tax=Paenibacillus zeirhizosphaerae TaxID=2987519 RepID=A0ABT9FT99_9BACL|nr:L,D-transpeptidase [Paenibacillus sp. P96]MDP4097721.1 L,D-transpeptidase [Paenibacillus sp. P96]
MSDTSHLKTYVKKHPDNKMGWYLLGKEYQNSGQEGKANYCFNKAGEVFEAFEKKQIPQDVWMEYQNKLAEIAHAQDKRNMRLRKLLVCCSFWLLILLPSAHAPGAISPGSGAASVVPEIRQTSAVIDEVIEQEASKEEVSPTAGSTNSEIKFTAADSTPESMSTKVGTLLSRQGSLPASTVVLGMKKEGNWLLWDDQLKTVYRLDKEGGGKVLVQSLDPKQCHCEPKDAAGLKAQATAWTSGQVELAVLNSSLIAYRQRYGGLPDNLQDLTKAFPDNVMDGVSEGMKPSFPSLRKRLADAQTADASAELAEGTALASSLDGTPSFTEPLRIIVDKSNYRLAVVSGNIMIRNYKVGLGGNKTPEGSYEISDKVVNPNGKSDGDFGSRGMQLSDTNYAIHGTNEPDSIEKDESLGCVRMSKQDVEELFALVPSGTPVTIQTGGLPDQELVPAVRYTSKQVSNQTNPNRIYHWLY